MGPEPFSPVRNAELELRELRREIEQLRAAHATATDSADARSRFLAHVSHELRTPMNSILGMTHLTLTTELTREQREYLDVINDSAESLLTLVNDLLDQAKIDAGMLVIEKIPFRIDDLVEGALRGVRVMTDHKGLKLDYEKHPSVPDVVIGDPTRLRQVLLNLVGNAAKFTEAGQIVISVAPAGDAASLVRFSVADTGIGIPSTELVAIFEEFRQADESTTRRFGGTGLGLSISARLVELLGGTLDVESDVGVGSTFHFVIPLPAAPAAQAQDPAVSASGARVLWLNDTHSGRQHAHELAVARGLAPEVSTSLEDAIDMLTRSEHPPAAIVVDLQIGALDAAWELGRESRGAPTLVITPGGQRGDGARCRELGIAGYLTGTIVPTDVCDALDAVLSGVPDLVTRHWLNERRKTLRILVADDSETNRTLLSRMFEKRGHTVLPAADGVEVLSVVARESIDVLLLDLHMPQLDGYATAIQIRKLEGDAATLPIIANSGSVNDDARARCQAIGIDAFIAKPFLPEQVLAIVEELAG